MRKREGIEPRNGEETVGADLVNNREGYVTGVERQDSHEPTGV
jgi:hypothetical protein